MLQIRQRRDGHLRLTLWHHVQPCPEDERRFDLILERSIPVIIGQETCAAKSKAELIQRCVEMTLMAYSLVTQGKADLPLWGTYVETAPGKFSLEEEASLLMRLLGRPLQIWRLTAPRLRRKPLQAG